MRTHELADESYGSNSTPSSHGPRNRSYGPVIHKNLHLRFLRLRAHLIRPWGAVSSVLHYRRCVIVLLLVPSFLTTKLENRRQKVREVHVKIPCDVQVWHTRGHRHYTGFSGLCLHRQCTCDRG